MPKFERLIPVLVYRDIKGAHDFLVEAFGFEPGGVERTATGEVLHGEVRVGGTTVWMHRVTAEHQLTSPENANLAGAGLVVHVSDVDAHFARARAAGARIEYEPINKPMGSANMRLAILKVTVGGLRRHWQHRCHHEATV
jgi:PhnB protein